MGVEIDFASFSAKAKSNGLQIGKRYRFRGTLGQDLTELCSPGGGGAGMLFNVVPELDDPTQQETALKKLADNWKTVYTIVASMGYDGKIHVHRVE